MTSMLGDPRRRGPRSSKYSNISSKLNTGPNMRKTLTQFEGTSGPNAHRKQRDEFFSTLKPLTLAKLLEPCMDEEESIYKVDADEVRSVASGISRVTCQSDIGSQVSMAGQISGNLLILDVRPYEEFEKCHVYGAMHYDKAWLSKSTNNFPKEVYYFRGPAESDKIVLLYDEDGKSMHAVANEFVQKGVENTYVLLGGFHGVCSRCPHLLSAAAPIAASPPFGATHGVQRLACSNSPSPPKSAASSRTQNTSLSYANSPPTVGSVPWGYGGKKINL